MRDRSSSRPSAFAARASRSSLRDVVGRLPAALFLVAVEGRQLEHRELALLAADFDLLEAQLGRLLFEIDLVALEADRETFRLGALAQHREPDDGALLAADHADHVAQVHVDHVDEFALGLCDAEDAVLRLDAAFLGRRAAGHHLFDDRVAVARGEHRADALERETHVDLEVLEIVGREVGGVGIEGGREGVEEASVDLVGLHLLGAQRHQLVAVDQLLLGFVERLAVGDVVRHLEVDQAPVEILASGLVGREAALLGIDLQRRVLVDRVVGPRDVVADEGLHLAIALDRRRVHLVELRAVAARDRAEHACELLAQRRRVRLEEERPRRIQMSQRRLGDALLQVFRECAVLHVILEVGAEQTRQRLAGQRARRGGRRGLGRRARGRRGEQQRGGEQGESPPTAGGPIG